MKILFPVSRDPSRGDALRLAVDTARAHKAHVRALFVVDREGIRRCEAGAPPGAIHLALQAAEKIAEREAAEGARGVEEAGEAFRDAGIPFSGEVTEGDPGTEIEKAAAGCDLVVGGIASRYSHDQEDEPGERMLSLMSGKVIPVLLAASPYRPVKTVVVGCGGGTRTFRAAEALARLGLWKGTARLVLLAVDDSPEGAEARLAEPRRILSEAGYPSLEERMVRGPKVEAFLSACQEEEADAAVLGGWGEHRWNEWLGRSITGRLLSVRRRHLFLYM